MRTRDCSGHTPAAESWASAHQPAATQQTLLLLPSRIPEEKSHLGAHPPGAETVRAPPRSPAGFD